MGFVYSKRLGSAGIAGAGSALVYTVPTGVTAVVRSCSFTCVSGSADAANLIDSGSYEIAGAEVGTLFVPTVVQLRAVMEPGDTLRLEATGGTWHVTVSGYELAGP